MKVSFAMLAILCVNFPEQGIRSGIWLIDSFT